MSARTRSDAGDELWRREVEKTAPPAAEGAASAPARAPRTQRRARRPRETPEERAQRLLTECLAARETALGAELWRLVGMGDPSVSTVWEKKDYLDALQALLEAGADAALLRSIADEVAPPRKAPPEPRVLVYRAQKNPAVVRRAVERGEQRAAERDVERPRNELFEAFAEVCKVPWRGLSATDRRRGVLNRLLPSLREVGATPETLRQAARVFRADNGRDPSPHEMARNYGRLLRRAGLVDSSPSDVAAGAPDDEEGLEWVIEEYEAEPDGILVAEIEDAF